MREIGREGEGDREGKVRESRSALVIVVNTISKNSTIFSFYQYTIEFRERI